MKLNNKGFVVSSVLYSILLAFLMFLGATLTMLSSANSLISKANSDLTDGKVLKAIQVKQSYNKDEFPDNTNRVCGTDFKWYQKYQKDEYGNIKSPLNVIESDIIVKINSSHGTMYWPKDFVKNGDFSLNSSATFKTITVKIVGVNNTSITNTVSNVNKIEITDGVMKTLIIGDICG